MWGENYPWHFDYVRLASDAGFAFERHKAQNFDKAKISMIDVERVIADRDVAAVERCIPVVVKFVLDTEQADFLDAIFVRTFRMTQLSVEYLLFCKKYLDNTVVQLKDELQKFKEENEELKTFVEELKTHIASLMAKIQEQAVAAAHRCNECSKTFSSEEFLTSHKRRRHTSSGHHMDGVEKTVDHETDKLHMEIKELKGRLNNAEKLMQYSAQENVTNGGVIHHNNNNGKEFVCGKENNSDLKILELQQKFESLKTQVEIEIRSLQYHQSLEEKCGKWFGYALQNVKMQEKEEFERNEKRVVANDLTSQTAQTITDEGRREEKGSAAAAAAETREHLLHAQKQMSQFSEALESKVTSSLQRIEEQMQSFWKKLHEMESSNPPAKADKTLPANVVYMQNWESSETSDEHNKRYHPPIKPRSRYTLMQAETEFQEIPESIKIRQTDRHDKSDKNEHKKATSNKRDKKTASPKLVEEQEEEEEEEEEEEQGEEGESEIDSEMDEKIGSKMDAVADDDVGNAATTTAPEVSSSSKPPPAVRPPSPKPRKSKIVATKSTEPEIVQRGETRSPEKSDKKKRKIKRTSTKNAKQSQQQQQDADVRTVTPPIKKSFWRKAYVEEESDTDSRDESDDVQKPSDKERLEIDTSTLKRDFQKEVERVLNDRLQSIGVSPDWKGLPDSSYERALSIVNHQAFLLKKTIPNFDSVSKHIKKKVARKVDDNYQPKIKSVAKKKKLEIKYRSMYATDSDSDDQNKDYDKVLEELRLAKRVQQPDVVDVKKPKKKVLFDLTDRNVKPKDCGGSTTSIASSVLDGTPRNPKKSQKKATKEQQQQQELAKSVAVVHSNKDIEDLSDFEFSDM